MLGSTAKPPGRVRRRPECDADREMLLNQFSSKKGFTLVELAIVLAIIGLIIGGVLVGSEMIKSAGVSKVASEYRQYESAFLTFRDKYNCLAGDCIHATRFGLGSNGDGDGKVWPYETRNVCAHLSEAKLIGGGCIEGFPPALGVEGGMNALPTAYKVGRLIELSYLTASAPYTGNYRPGNYLSMGGASPAGNYYPWGVFNSVAMYPDDARRLDMKIDDERPLSGKLRQYENYVCADMATNTYSMYYIGNGFCSSDYMMAL